MPRFAKWKTTPAKLKEKPFKTHDGVRLHCNREKLRYESLIREHGAERIFTHPVLFQAGVIGFAIPPCTFSFCVTTSEGVHIYEYWRTVKPLTIRVFKDFARLGYEIRIGFEKVNPD